MKKITLILTTIASIAIVACSSSTANNNSINNNNNQTAEADRAASILGIWTPIALDFNLDGKTEPSGQWKYNTKEDEALVKQAGLEMDYGNFTFKANGIGYLGAKETVDNTFKWKKMANGRFTIDDGEVKNTTAENIEEFYLDAKGQLIFHHTEKPKIMGKDVVQNSFELYKRK
jgi:hypothetical protein